MHNFVGIPRSIDPHKKEVFWDTDDGSMGEILTSLLKRVYGDDLPAKPSFGVDIKMRRPADVIQRILYRQLKTDAWSGHNYGAQDGDTIDTLFDAIGKEMSAYREIAAIVPLFVPVVIKPLEFKPMSSRNVLFWINNYPVTLAELESLSPGLSDRPLAETMLSLCKLVYGDDFDGHDFDLTHIGMEITGAPDEDSVEYATYQKQKEAEKAFLDELETISTEGEVAAAREKLMAARKEYLMVSKLSKE